MKKQLLQLTAFAFALALTGVIACDSMGQGCGGPDQSSSCTEKERWDGHKCQPR